MHIDFLFDVFKEFYSNDSLIYKSEEYSYKYLIENPFWSKQNPILKGKCMFVNSQYET